METTRKFKCISHESTRLMPHWVLEFTIGNEYELVADDIEVDGTIKLLIPGNDKRGVAFLWVDASCFEEVK